MSATNRAVSINSARREAIVPPAVAGAAANSSAMVFPAPARVPELRVMPLLQPTQSRRFVRVPTHAVAGTASAEQREYPRASLKLPLRLRSVAGVPEDFPVTLVTRDVSSTGVFFLCPKQIVAGTAIELEIVLVSRPMGRGNVVIATSAHVRRQEPAAMPGWYGIAAFFDDVEFGRDDCLPFRFSDL
jgi:hypothetical protein